MTTCEKKYSAIEKEALAIYKCLERMRSLVLGRDIIIMADHCPLCYIMHKSIKNKRINRITHLIQEYNIDKIVHIQGRYNCLPDYLSRYSKEQDDDLFNIDYGLSSKNNPKISSLTFTENASKLLSPESSTQQKFIAPMTLRPRKKQTITTNHNVSTENHTTISRQFDTLSHSENIKKKNVSTNHSQNYFDTAKLKIEKQHDTEIQKIVRNLDLKSNKISFVLKDEYTL